MDQPPAVAFIGFADVWPGATRNGNRRWSTGSSTKSSHMHFSIFKTGTLPIFKEFGSGNSPFYSHFITALWRFSRQIGGQRC